MTRTEKIAARSRKFIDGPVKYGFEPEDRNQEIVLGRLIAERKYGDHEFAAYRRGRAQLAMHCGREARHNGGKISLQDHDRAVQSRVVDHAVLNEIMISLPEDVRDEVADLTAENDGRKIRKAGRLIREALPDIDFGV